MHTDIPFGDRETKTSLIIKQKQTSTAELEINVSLPRQCNTGRTCAVEWVFFLLKLSTLFALFNFTYGLPALKIIIENVFFCINLRFLQI